MSNAKKRPALVAATLSNEDVILCPITSTKRNDSYDVDVSKSHFSSGNLNNASSIRIHRLFTANKKIILYKSASLKRGKINEVEKRIVEIVTR